MEHLLPKMECVCVCVRMSSIVLPWHGYSELTPQGPSNISLSFVSSPILCVCVPITEKKAEARKGLILIYFISTRKVFFKFSCKNVKIHNKKDLHQRI